MKVKELISNIIWFAGLILVLFLLRTYVLSPVSVSGDSMVPTLHDKERVMQIKLAGIERFDIVTFPAPDQPGQNYIKRVIGLPGDTISFKEDQLYINDKEVSEEYLEEAKKETTESYTSYRKENGEILTDFSLEDIDLIGTATIPEGKVFVLGDNRPISKDSRYLGLIDLDKVSGDVKFRFWPLNKIGTIGGNELD